VGAIAVVAVPLNLLLIGLLAVDAPRLFAAWLGLLLVGLLYQQGRMNYGGLPGRSA